MKDVTCGIKTFLRPDCLKRLLDSIYSRYPQMAVVVIDDSREDSINPDDYPKVTYSKLPFDSGLGAGRNAMIDLVKTKYCLYLDDDFVFNEHTAIEKFRAVLEGSPADLVGGFVQEKRGGRLHTRQYHGLIAVKNKKLIYRKGNRGTFVVPHGDGTLQCEWVDITLNFFLADTKLLQKVGWDPHLKINTHTEFFLRAKEQMKIAFCSKVGCFHAPTRPKEYKKYRGRRYRPYILKKHGASGWIKRGQWT